MNKRILVVDDDRNIRSILLEEFLEYEEYEVNTATDGLDGDFPAQECYDTTDAHNPSRIMGSWGWLGRLAKEHATSACQQVMERKQEGDLEDDQRLPCAWCLSEQRIAIDNGSHGICSQHADQLRNHYRTLRRHAQSGVRDVIQEMGC